MNANPTAPTPTEGSTVVRLATALEYAQKKSGESLVDILDEVTSIYWNGDGLTGITGDEADSALIALVYEHF